MITSPITYAPPYAQYPSCQPVVGYGAPCYMGVPQAAPQPQPQPQQASQQQSVVVVSGAQQDQQRPAQSVLVRRRDAFFWHILFACTVTWAANIVCGLIAFVLAVMAKDEDADRPLRAKRLGHASLLMSVIGVVSTVILIVVFVAVAASRDNTTSGGYSY